jgi:hypothetical protein
MRRRRKHLQVDARHHARRDLPGQQEGDDADHAQQQLAAPAAAALRELLAAKVLLDGQAAGTFRLRCIHA